MISVDFASELKKLLEGDKQIASRPIVVGRPSEILSKCGANINQDITITKKVIDKAMRPEIRDEDGRMVGNTGHGLTEDLIVQSLNELDSPTLIFKGRQEGSILVITSIEDQKDRNIVVAIEFDRQEGFTQVNSIRSVYGRDSIDFFIGDNIREGKSNGCKKRKG